MILLDIHNRCHFMLGSCHRKALIKKMSEMSSELLRENNPRVEPAYSTHFAGLKQVQGSGIDADPTQSRLQAKR